MLLQFTKLPLLDYLGCIFNPFLPVLLCLLSSELIQKQVQLLNFKPAKILCVSWNVPVRMHIQV